MTDRKVAKNAGFARAYGRARITPLEDRVALEIVKEEMSAGGLHLVGTPDYQAPEHAIVRAIGPKVAEQTNLVVGDTVLILRGAGTGNDVTDDDGETYRMVRLEHVLARLA